MLRAGRFGYAQFQLCIQLSRFFTAAMVAATTHKIEWALAAVVFRKIPYYFILWLLTERRAPLYVVVPGAPLPR